jgi:hypothetical protein
MAKGDRPLFHVTFRKKDSEKGTKGRELCAIWKSKFPSQHNLNFPIGTQIRLPDGTVIKADDYWFTCWINTPKEAVDPWDEAVKSAPPVTWEQEKLPGEGFTPEPEEKKVDDDIPF